MSITKPHLACDADLDRLPYPVFGTPKIDGVRLMNIKGDAVGRSLKPFKNKSVTDALSLSIYTGFDGEITPYGINTHELLCSMSTSIMNTIEGHNKVTWWLFDYLAPEVLHMCYKQRLQALKEYVDTLVVSQHKCDYDIQVIEYVIINNKEEAEAFYEDCLDAGFEGAIFRDPKGMHKNGRCTAKEGNYTRLKPSSDKEAIVCGVVEALVNNNEATINELGHTERSSHQENKTGKGMVGMLVCRELDANGRVGQEIHVGAGKMTHSERIHYFQNQEEIIGQTIKFRSMDIGVKLAPRFARYLCIRALEDMSK